MKLGRLPWQHEPDAEFIARIRRQIKLMDRFRLWAILFSLGMLATIVWVFHDILGRVIQFPNGANPAWPVIGFVIGTVTGIAFGSLIHGVSQNLLFALGISRSERLMLRFYDTIHEEETDQDPPLEEHTEQ